MHPLMIALTTVGSFFGMVLSFGVGWKMDEWITKIFSYRATITYNDTQVTFAATKEEIRAHKEAKLEEAYDYDSSFQYYGRRPEFKEPQTPQELLESLTEKQRDQLYFIVGAALEQQEKTIGIADLNSDKFYVEAEEKYLHKPAFVTVNEARAVLLNEQIKGMKWGVKDFYTYDERDI